MKQSLLLLLLSLIIFSACKKDETTEEIIPGNTIVISEDIKSDVTWKTGNTYVIDGTIRVGNQQGLNLVIEPGVIVKFKESSGLDISYWDDEYATVTALGTADKPIIFTSNSSVKNKGDWECIAFYKGSVNCKLAHCQFSYGGSNDYYGTITIDECEIAFDNCRFTNSESDAVKTRNNGHFASFTNNTFESNGGYPIYTTPYAISTIGTGNVYESGSKIYVDDIDLDKKGTFTWKKQAVPYTVNGTVRIGHEQQTKLIIEAGVNIQFFNSSGFDIAYFETQTAQIFVNGTSTEPVVFTSNSPVPAKGDWEGISFHKGVNGSELNYLIIEYAGSNDYYGSLAFSESGINTVSMNNCTVARSKSYGITVDTESSVDVSSTTFTDNDLADYYIR